MKRIYIAAPFAARPLALKVAARLIEAGHNVTSKWATETSAIDESTVGPASGSSGEVARQHATGDLDDICSAQVVLLLTGGFVHSEMSEVPLEWLHTGGRHFETGYALARGLDIVILGEPENLFHRAFGTAFPTFDLVLEHLTERAS